MDIILNKDDIQTIRQVVKEEVSDLIKPIKTDISSLKTDISSLKTDVSSLKTDISSLKTDVSSLKTDMKIVKADIRTLKQDVSYISREFDGQIVDMIRRVDRIEDHLHLPPCLP
jgi:peptidoglycan hydrolase CwlO-like protein